MTCGKYPGEVPVDLGGEGVSSLEAELEMLLHPHQEHLPHDVLAHGKWDE